MLVTEKWRRVGYAKISAVTEASPPQAASTGCTVHRALLVCGVAFMIAELFLLFFSVSFLLVVVLPSWGGASQCGSPSQYTVCNWPSFYGSTPTAVHMPISNGNPLSVNDVDSKISARFEDELTLACAQGGHSTINATCSLFDVVVSSVGVNGIMDAVDNAWDDCKSEAWGSLIHLVGAWSMATSLRRWSSPRPAIEVVGSFKLDGAPLHAAVWLATMNYGTTSPQVLWHHALHDLCNFGGESLDLVVHCLHGFGHGVLFAAATARPSSTVNTKKSNPYALTEAAAALACASSATVLRLNIASTTLTVARAICEGGSNWQIRSCLFFFKFS